MKRTILFFAFCIVAMMAEAVTLSGNVKTDSLKALPFASVYVKDARMGATTDLDGNYSIKGIPAGKHTLVISYMGYKTQTMEITLSGDDTRNFVMEEQAITLNDIFVTPTGESIERFILSQVVKNRKKLTDVMESFSCNELYRLEQRNNNMKVLIENHLKTFDFVVGVLGLKGFLHVIMDHPDLKLEVSTDISFEKEKLAFSNEHFVYNNPQLSGDEKNAFLKVFKKKTTYHYDAHYDKLVKLKKQLEKMDKKDKNDTSTSEEHLKYCGSYEENDKVVHILQSDNEQYHIVDGCWQLRRATLMKKKSKTASFIVEFYELANNVFLPISYYSEGSFDFEKFMQDELDDLKKEDTSTMSQKKLAEHNARIERLQKTIDGEESNYKTSYALTYTDFKVK